MGRTKEFDEEVVIDKAVRAFLKDSYSTTSVSALESATGVGRKSLYNTFGSKPQLLLRAMEKFSDRSTASFIEPLEQPGASRAAIEHVVHAMVAQMTSKSGRDGCLLCVFSQSPDGTSKAATDIVDAYFARARAGFLKCIKAGIDDGTISTAGSPPALADYFVGVLMGISTMARAGSSTKAIKHFAKVAIDSLG